MAPGQFLLSDADSPVRLWDVRAGHHVKEWIHEEKLVVNCLETDNSLTFVTGTEKLACVRVWDKRHPEKLINIFKAEKGSTPSNVYSIDFDHEHLYCCLDHQVIHHNFNVPHNQLKSSSHKIL